MKKNYYIPTIECIKFSADDIISTSLGSLTDVSVQNIDSISWNDLFIS